MENDIRLWVEYRALENAKMYKIKIIQVNPNGRLFLQYDYHRFENWAIISGVGTITINEVIKKF